MQGVRRHDKGRSALAANPILLAVNYAQEVHNTFQQIEDLGVRVAVRWYSSPGFERLLLDGKGVCGLITLALPGETRASNIKAFALPLRYFVYAFSCGDLAKICLH